MRDALLTPAAVAELFGVSPRTISRWAEKGRLTSIRTAGGHHRYHREDVERLARESGLSISHKERDPK